MQSLSRIQIPILLGLTIFIALFVLRPIYTGYIDSLTQRKTLETEIQTLKTSLESLNSINTGSGTHPEEAEKVRKLQKKWSAPDIMQAIMLSEHTKPMVGSNPRIRISDITLDRGSKTPNGLSLGKVRIGVSASSIADIVEYVTYLTTQSEFIFTIDSISLPLDTAPESINELTGINVTLDFGVYYYE